MDWINQNKFRNWLIVVLLVLNVLTVSIIWMQTAREKEPQPKDQAGRASESATLLRKALDLTDAQTNQLKQMQAGHLEELKKDNDRLSGLKTQLAEELFNNNPDTALANSLSKEIGELQSKVEIMRFRHFNELLAICTPEQREKLRPIVTEIFGRKPPRDEPRMEKQPGERSGEEVPRGRSMRQPDRETPHELPDKESGPPSVDEKVAKYSERLKLTGEQARKIRAVLLSTRERGERLRTRVNPDQQETQAEMERIRKEEDESVMKLLSEDQKKEFAGMILKRSKRSK